VLVDETISRILLRLSSADGHFSAATIARCVTIPVSQNRSNQPEDSAGRVIAFCLVLHRARVAELRVTAKLVGWSSDRFNLTQSANASRGMLSVALSRLKARTSNGRR